MIIESMFVYHFLNPDLRVEIIFRKEGTAENGGIDFEIRDMATRYLCTLVLEVQEVSCRTCLHFYYFFGHKKKNSF